MTPALNHMTVPGLSFAEFLSLASRLGCAGVELRNDMGRPLFDGMPAAEAAARISDAGLRLFGLSQIYPFNDWTPARADETRALIDTALAVGADTISLIPRNDGAPAETPTDATLAEILPMLQDADLMALVEPLGFPGASLRLKADAVAAIEAVGGSKHFMLVHDTFHHALSDEGQIFAARTAMVHVSGVSDPAPEISQMRDAHRGTVDADDRLGNLHQLAVLRAAGYEGPVSLECFSPALHALADPFTELKQTFEFIFSHDRAARAA